MSALSNLIENKALMFGAAAVAFFVAAVLILLVFRLAFGRRLRMPGGRTRQLRLGIVDAFDLDRQRQLVLVRRDNVEHLIMIGGPNDILIETQIVRTEAREGRSRDKDAREREPSVPAPSAKSPMAEPKLGIPPLAPEPHPAAATEATLPAAITPLPSLAPVSPGSRQPTSAPSPRRPLTPAAAPAPAQKPLPPHAPAIGETDHHQGAPQAPKPMARPTQPGEPPPAFMLRWPTRTPTPPAPPPKRTALKPAMPDALPEPPPAGPPLPTLEGLESLEEEMAKLLGRGPPKP